MTARLPTPGGDDGNWGDILNAYLEVEHNSDGTLKKASDIAAAKAAAQSAVQSVNGKTGTSVTLAAADVSAVGTSQVGATSGVASLDSGGKLTTTQIPTSVVSGSVDVSAAAALREPVWDSSVSKLILRDPNWINVKRPPYNAKGDWQANSTDASMSSTTNPTQLTVASYTFTSADVGKIAVVKGAGAAGVLLYGTITGVSSGKAILSVSASTTVSGVNAAWGTDDTTAINNALTAAGANGSAMRTVYVPQGWYRFTQLVVPSGVRLIGDGWGGAYGVAFGFSSGARAGTLLQQLEGAERHGLVFVEEFHDVPNNRYWVGPVELEHFTLQGPLTGTTGDGIYMGVAGPHAGITQDGFRCDHVHVIGFPGNGWTFPTGGLPMFMRACRAFFNDGYGLYFNGSGGVQGIHLADFSGDANGQALMQFTNIKNFTDPASVVLTNIKSEAATLKNVFGATPMIERGSITAARQLIGIDINNCTNPFAIHGITHISSAKDYVTAPDGSVLQAPGPAIQISGGSTSAVSFAAIATRLNSGGDTGAANAVTLLDTTYSITIPLTVRDGHYNGADPGIVTGVYGKRPRFIVGKGDAYQEGPSNLESGGIQVSGETPGFSQYETDGGSQSKHWIWVSSGGQTQLRAVDDDGTATEVLWQGSRTPSKVSSLLLGSSATGAKLGFYGGTARAKSAAAASAESILATLGTTAGLGLVDDSATGAITCEETLDRRYLSQTGTTLTSGRLVFACFQARSSITPTQVLIPTGASGATAAGAGALIRVGLWSMDTTNLTLLAASTNDVSAMVTAQTEVAKTLSTAPAFIAGNWYAYSLLVVSTSMPNSVAAFLGSSAQGKGGNGRHRLTGFLASQTDLPSVGSTVTIASLSDTQQMLYGVFL